MPHGKTLTDIGKKGNSYPPRLVVIWENNNALIREESLVTEEHYFSAEDFGEQLRLVYVHSCRQRLECHHRMYVLNLSAIPVRTYGKTR